jgi:ribonuclease P protein component
VQDLDNTFPEKNRLLAASEYKKVFARPVRSTDKYFTVLATAGNSNEPRLGLAISKKNTRLATDRNRLKRLVRESFRHHKEIVSGLDLVIMAKFGAAKADNRKLFESLSTHWKNLSEKRHDS